MDVEDCIDLGMNRYLDHMMLNSQRSFLIDKEEEEFLEENKNPSEIMEIKHETEQEEEKFGRKNQRLNLRLEKFYPKNFKNYLQNLKSKRD